MAPVAAVASTTSPPTFLSTSRTDSPPTPAETMLVTWPLTA